MDGLDKRLRLLSKNTRNIFEHGIKSLWNRTSEYVEAGIDRTREYLETASKYVTNTGNRIREKVEIAKEVMPYALMNTLISNRFGQAGYYGAKAFTFYQMSKGNIGGKWNSKIPLIVGAISGAVGLGIGILLGDHNILNHPYHESSGNQQYQELQQELQNLENQSQGLQHQIQYLQNQIQNLENQSSTNFNGLNQQYQQLQQQYQNLENLLQNLQNQDKTLQQEVQNLQSEVQNLQNLNNQYQQLQQQYHNLENQYQNLENEYQQLQQQYQNIESQLQNINTLTDVLFGNGNSNDISVIQINSVQIVNGYAVVNGNVYSTGENVTLGIPISYVENSNVNIQEFVNDVQQNGQNAYIAIDRADLKYMGQSGYVISIQPNEPVNIAVMASPANSSTLDYVLNHLTQYDIAIQDSNNVYNSPNALWGYTSNSSVIVNFSNSSQYQLAENMINIADQIINSPGNSNPTGSGYIDTYSIFNGTLTINTNQDYPQYNVGQTYIPLIVLKSGQGNTIINSVSS